MATKAAPRTSLSVFIIPIAIIGAGAAYYFRLPGVAVLWLGLLMTAWTEPPPELTGKKNGQVIAGNSAEEDKQRRYYLFVGLKWRLLGPNRDWFPAGFEQANEQLKEKPIWQQIPIRLVKYAMRSQGAWFGGLIAAGVAYLAPLNAEYVKTPQLMLLVHAIAALLGFIVAVSLSSAFRTNAKQGPGCPGCPLMALPAMGEGRNQKLAILAGSIIAVGVFVYAGLRFIPATNTVYAIGNRALLAAVLAALGLALVITGPWRTASLSHWRLVRQGHREWSPRWEMLKQDPAPQILDREMIGDATVDLFAAPGGVGAMGYWALGPKIIPTMGGAGMTMAVMSVPAKDSDGQPVPGTKHPLNFKIASWPAGSEPVMTDPSTPEDQVQLWAQAAVVRALGSIGYGVPLLLGVQRITTAESPAAVWASKWAWPDGPGWTTIRTDQRDAMPGGFECPTLIDHRSDVFYFGAIGDPNLEWIDEQPPGGFAQVLENLEVDDHWSGVWKEADKTNGTANPPRREHAVSGEATLAGGAVIQKSAFMTRRGVEPSSYFTLTGKLATALNSAPFVAVTGYPGQGRDRRGERHSQALVVYHSESPVPARLDDLEPVQTRDPEMNPCKWVIAGKINKAFSDARLAQPEVAAVRSLTGEDSKKHIWEITLRLYGGVTLSDVRGGANRMLSSLGVDWLRFTATPDGDGCVVFAGALPDRVTLLSPRRDALRLTALDWEQGFIDAKLTPGTGGLLPTLTAIGNLPANKEVQVLDFTLPAGIDSASVKGLTKLKGATKNEFIEVRPGTSGANSMRLLVCRHDPMPSRVDYDFDFRDALGALPFATSIEGIPLTIDLREVPHLLVSGTSGGGKSATAQGLMYAALVGGADIAIIDIQKKGADFKFVHDRTIAFSTTVAEAAATMKALYAEVQRRADLNAEYGVGSVRDLPDEVKPKAICVFIDEFLGVIMAGTRPPRQEEDDPEREQQRLQKLAAFNARKDIGFLAGRIAAEARSADVHLVLMTQRLIASMLDDDLKDLKDLALDTRLPVPVSEKFPSGWATNAELEIGDLLYTPSGGTAPVAGFSEVFTDNEMYEVTFDDGQTVRVGAEHLWTASDHNSRRRLSASKFDESDKHRLARADTADRLAKTLPVGTWAEPREIADLLGYPNVASIIALAEHFGLDRMVRLASGQLRIADRLPKGDEEAGEQDRFMVEVPEFCSALNKHLLQETVDDPQLEERVVSTREMADSLCAPLSMNEWFIHTSSPIDGPEEKLPTHPFTLGTLLSDGGTSAVIRGRLRDNHIPVQYLRASFHQKLALLQGFMNKDGSVDASGQYTLPQTNKQMAEGVMELIRSLGINGHWSGQNDTTSRVWNISFRTNLPAFRLPRKLEKQVEPVEGRRCSRRYVRTIEPIASVPTRCIAVDSPEHLFLVEGFIPTHNTNMARILLGKTNQGERMSALRDPENAPPLGAVVPKGRGIWESTMAGAEMAQFWYSSTDTYRAQLVQRVPEMTDDRRLNIEPFLIEVKPSSETAGSVIIDDDDVIEDVAELAEFSFDLGDLELETDVEPDTDAPADAPAVIPEPDNSVAPADTVPIEVAPELASALLCLDIDGTLGPLGDSEWGGPSIYADGGAAGSATVPVSLIDAVRELHVPLGWLSSWNTDAPDAFADVLPTDIPVLEVPGWVDADMHGWWKITALLEHLESNPGIDRVVWADDELGNEDELGLTFSELAAELLDERGIGHLLVATDPETGLTPDDLERIEQWLQGEPVVAAAAPVFADELELLPDLPPEPQWDDDEPTEPAPAKKLEPTVDELFTAPKRKPAVIDDDLFAAPVRKAKQPTVDLFG